MRQIKQNIYLNECCNEEALQVRVHIYMYDIHLFMYMYTHAYVHVHAFMNNMSSGSMLQM